MTGFQLGFGFDALPPVPAAMVEAARPARPASSLTPEGACPGLDPGAEPEGELVPAPVPDPRNDGILDVALARSRNMLVPWYLIASWSYFVGDHPLLTDARFDRLCRELDAEWDAIEHRHKPLVDRAWLPAATCGLARDAYPPSVRGAAAHLARVEGVVVPRV